MAKQKPKGSEHSIKDWLEQIGATEIQFVGGESEGGPPDYTIQYVGEQIGVEVRLLDDITGWPRNKRMAFEKELKCLIEEVAQEKDAPRWHTCCEYDPKETQLPRPECMAWKEKVRKALRTKGTGEEIELLSPKIRRGRGVRLTLKPANNEGSFVGASVDEGDLVAQTLGDRVVACVKEKTNKVQRGNRSHRHLLWWLVFDDEILLVPIGVLGADERAAIKAKVRACNGREQWSKIVIVSRFQTVPASQKFSRQFCALWEDPQHPPLPPSPA